MKNITLQAVTLFVIFAKKIGKLTACLCTLGLLISCDQKPLPEVSKSPPEIKPKNELSRALYSAHLQLDPQFVRAIADAAPLRDLLVGLMQFNPKGEVIPGIATSITSKDGKNWQIQLDKNAMWSNGEPVTAQDFIASWQRLSDPRNASPLSYYLLYMGVKNAKEIIQGTLSPTELGVGATDPKRLTIELNSPNFQLPKMLAHLALLPTYQGKNTSLESLEEPFISNGAYKIDSRTKLNLTLKANSPDIPFQKVSYQLIGTIKNPERFDIIENPLEDYHRYDTKLPRLCTYYYEFNFKDQILAQKEVRQAIRSMISPSEISRDLGIPNHLALPKTLYPDLGRNLSTTSAEQLLHSLGINSSNPLTLTLTYDDQKLHKYIANRIERTLGQSDLFKIRSQVVDWKTLLAKRDTQSFQLIRSGWCADYNDPVLFLMPFHSTSPDNKSGYTNAKVDKLLEQLKSTNLDNNIRKKMIFDIVKLLENDVAILPLFQYQLRLSIAPDIRGVEMINNSEVIYSKDLYRQ